MTRSGSVSPVADRSVVREQLPTGLGEAITAEAGDLDPGSRARSSLTSAAG
jgi:hypothetical protein